MRYKVRIKFDKKTIEGEYKIEDVIGELERITEKLKIVSVCRRKKQLMHGR